MARILFVEDSEELRNDFEYNVKTLSENKHEVVLAENGQQGLDILQDQSKGCIDLIFTDINMPIMDGITMLENIRKDEKNNKLPVFVLTTETDPKIRAKGQELKIKSWIYKPYNIKAILKIIDTCILKPDF